VAAAEGEDMQAERALLEQAGRVVATIAATVVAAYLVAATVRYGLIEREDLGLLCDTPAAPWWCSVRLLIIKAFLHDVFGLSSVVLAAAAAWRRSRSVAVLAVAIGTIGMVLYGFTWSGIGVLGGALVLARLQGQGQQHR
jgi:glycerol uptake facilitator-like aquaporin